VTHRRTDRNQATIVQALRECGAIVIDLSSVGAGCPDLLVSFRGKARLLEVKNRDGRGVILTPAEQRFFQTWEQAALPAQIVTGPEAALLAIGAIEG